MPNSASLQDQVVALAQDLIRADTTNPPGEETPAAELLCGYLQDAGVECELMARDARRANVVARIRGAGSGPSLAFVGHTDVVPADPRDWSHPPFEGVVDDDGYLYGRGAVDMKNEVAARAVAVAELARRGLEPRGDLWFLAVADEEAGTADVGMRWLLEERPDIRPDFSVNEGGGVRLDLPDGRRVLTLGVGEKGMVPMRVTAVGESGHASTPTVGRNAVPVLVELLRRVGRGLPVPRHSDVVDHVLAVLLDADPDARGASEGLGDRLARAAAMHPALGHLLPALGGTTLAPTMLSGSAKRNVMPARASADLDCRVLPGTTPADVERELRSALGDDLPYELTSPDPSVAGSISPIDGPVLEAVRAFLGEESVDADVLPVLETGFTDSSHLRRAAGTAAYGFSPFLTTPAEVVVSGYHNADERIHVDDLLLSTRFHVFLARRLLGGTQHAAP